MAMQRNNKISWGDISFHSFLITVVSGVVIAFKYNPFSPFQSLEIISGIIPWGEFFRRLHYYSAQFFLISLFLHKWEYMRKNIKYPVSRWFWEVVIFFPLSFVVVFTGYVLRGSREGIFAMDVAINLLKTVPVVGSSFARIVFGNVDSTGLYIVFINHVLIFTLPFFFVFFWHARLVFPDLKKLGYVLFWVTLLSLALNPVIGKPVNYPLDPVKGPWFFLGIQELVYEVYPWLGGVVFPVIALIILALYPRGRIIKIIFWLIVFWYFVLTIVAGFLRGPGWSLRL